VSAHLLKRRIDYILLINNQMTFIISLLLHLPARLGGEGVGGWGVNIIGERG